MNIIMTSCSTYEFRITVEPTALTYFDIIQTLKGIAKHFVFQYELGEETELKHYQGRLSLIKKKRPHLATSLWLKAWGDRLDGLSWFFRPTTNKEYLKGSFIYQTKLDTRIDGPWSDKDIPAYVPRHIRGITPYPFQEEVLNTMNIYDDRHINCIIDPKGNNGKSVLTSLVRNRGGISIPCCGDTERLIATVCNILTAKQLRVPRLIVVDLPRSINNTRLYSLMTAIEVIKDGYVYDTRNHYTDWEYDKPQIWVFTNNPIPTKYMSNDRWNFYTIDEDRNLKEETISQL